MQKILSPFSTPILWNTLFKNLLIPNNILREVEKNLNLKRNKTFILTFQQNPCKQIEPWKIFFLPVPALASGRGHLLTCFLANLRKSWKT